jgi:hypothetical protein
VKDKKRYYGLDEIGFVGTQEKGTSAQIKKDIQQTVQYIKDKKAGKAGSARRKKRTSISKVK